MKRIHLLIIFISFFTFSFGQKGKEYFLIDSINYETLSKNDKLLLDTILPLYHATKSDTARLKYLNVLTENMSEESAWPRYTELLYTTSRLLLQNPASLNKKEINAIKKAYAMALQNMGYEASMKSDNTKALEYYEECLNIQHEIGDKHGEVATVNNIAAVFEFQGYISKALEYYFKSLKVAEEIHYNQAIGYAAQNIGTAYLNLEDTVKATEYLTKSMKVFEESGNKRGIAFSAGNLSRISLNRGDYQTAMQYYTRSLGISEELGEQSLIAGALNDIGLLYLQQFEKGITRDNPDHAVNDSLYRKCLTYLGRALKIYETTNDKHSVSLVLASMGNIYFLNNDMSNALTHAKRSFDTAKEIGYPGDIFNSANILYKVYRKQKKYEDALAMYELRVQMRDSVLNEQTKKSSFQQQTKYEYEKQQAIKDTEHQNEMALVEEEKKRQQIISYSVGLGLLMVIIFSIFIFNRLRITRKQKLIIETQKKIVDQKNENITDSITYAKRIQDSTLPSREELFKCFSEHFIFFRPRDIVSGDFYWVSSLEGKTILAVVDCTGHGVPGAFMSMIGNTLLNKIVNEQKVFQPDEILKRLDDGIVNALHQESRAQHDGMDISICLFEKGKNSITFAGANHYMYVIKEGQIQKIQGNRHSIGSMFGKKQKTFTQQEISVQENSSVYFFTDGFSDQVGGKNGKKFLTYQLEKLLLDVSSLEIKKQEEEIIRSFENWQGKYAQLDDLLMMGIKI